MPGYNPKAIEPRWQQFWESHKTFRTSDDPGGKPKFYVLDMFPYPSGAGLHVGHPEGYTATDILARYRRMCGWHVLHPMGWDAFGLPAEQYAIKEKKHPHGFTQANIDTFRRQIKMLGFSYDWDREVDTTDPSYFKWTQWIFLLLHDTWYDDEAKKGRPIAELPIPPDVRAQGDEAVRRYQDSKRLAYQAEVPVNWCPALGTVLANEEVIDGKSERGGHPVMRMPLRQWLLRITAYAERLLDDLALVDWSHAIKEMQRNWIGKSVGAEVDFRVVPVEGKTADDVALRVFTTRPDTLFGATYMVLAPEHPLVDILTTSSQRDAIAAYKAEAARKSDLERTELAKHKTGVFTGAFAINPVNQAKIPIWIADYVLISYGTGAIMAVPAHDERDFEFARQYHLPIVPVVLPPRDWLRSTKVHREVRAMAGADDDAFDLGEAPEQSPSAQSGHTLSMISPVIQPATAVWEQFGGDVDRIVEHLYLHHPTLFDTCFVDDGTAVNSGEFDGLPTPEFKQRITAWLEARGIGTLKVNYKLRDWLFSRQRYWGEPFPILHEVDAEGRPTGLVRTIPLSELPLRLPELEDFAPTGKPEPPLEKAADWVWVTIDGKRYKRETNTMPQWAGSCWYYLRFVDPRNDQAFCDPKKEQTFLPVDLYVGGAEHAVLHLLYARFWHKVLYDRGYVHTPEPFHKLVNQGMILGEVEFTGYKADGKWVSAVKDVHETWQAVKLDEDQVEKHGEHFVLKENPQIRVDARAHKMSKARGNVINPDVVVDQYGADSLRLYEMFMGPLEAVKPWSMRGVEGVYRFLARVWRLVVDERADEARLAESVQDIEPDKDTRRKLHQTIEKVTRDLDAMQFNTAIAAMMEYVNHLTKLSVRPRAALEPFVLLLAPFAPHLGEELWRILGHADTLAYAPWPKFDPAWIKADEIEIPIQVNGKLRSKVVVPADADPKALEAAALADERIRELLSGKTVQKAIVVPRKLVNLVVN